MWKFTNWCNILYTYKINSRLIHIFTFWWRGWPEWSHGAGGQSMFSAAGKCGLQGGQSWGHPSGEQLHPAGAGGQGHTLLWSEDFLWGSWQNTCKLEKASIRWKIVTFVGWTHPHTTILFGLTASLISISMFKRLVDVGWCIDWCRLRMGWWPTTVSTSPLCLCPVTGTRSLLSMRSTGTTWTTGSTGQAMHLMGCSLAPETEETTMSGELFQSIMLNVHTLKYCIFQWNKMPFHWDWSGWNHQLWKVRNKQEFCKLICLI